MGDRATVTFNFGTACGITLYTHNGGYNLPHDLQDALTLSIARRRWSDPHYLARILISQIIGDDWNGETGYGLSPHDDLENQYEELIVNLPGQLVSLAGEGYPFDAYCLLTREEIDRLWTGQEEGS